MTLTNIIDARPHTPTPTYATEALLLTPDPREERLSHLETKLAELEAAVKDLKKIATVLETVHDLEARLKTLQSLVVELYDMVNHMRQTPQPPPQSYEAKIADQPTNHSPTPPPIEKSEPSQTDKKEDLQTLSDIERMVLRVLYRKLEYWVGRANLKVDDKGYAVIGRDVNFGVKFSQFVAIMTKFGLSDYVIARGNDRAGYYVEIKATQMGDAIRHLKTLDDQLKGALSRLL